MQIHTGQNRFLSAPALLVLFATALLGIGAGIGVGLFRASDRNPVDPLRPVVVERSVMPFHSVRFVRKDSGGQRINVVVAVGETPRVAVIGQHGVHRMIRAEVVGGQLYVFVDGDPRTEIPTRVHIATPHLRRLTVDGLAHMRVTGVLQESTVRLEATRGAVLAANRLGARHLHVTVRRGARIDLGGHTTMLKASATGGVLDARGLKAAIAQVSSVDEGHIEVDVADEIEVHARSRGSVRMSGTARPLSSDVDATSSFTAL